MKFYKCRNVKTPERGTAGSAGIDFFVPELDDKFAKDLLVKNPIYVRHGKDVAIYLDPQERILIPSGIHAKVPRGHAMIAFNKSGVSTKKGLDVLACVVDNDYTGEIHISLFNSGNTTQEIKFGEKLVQFVILPVNFSSLEEMKSIEEVFPQMTDRGAGGFGSTGN